MIFLFFFDKKDNRIEPRKPHHLTLSLEIFDQSSKNLFGYFRKMFCQREAEDQETLGVVQHIISYRNQNHAFIPE